MFNPKVIAGMFIRCAQLRKLKIKYKRKKVEDALNLAVRSVQRIFSRQCPDLRNVMVKPKEKGHLESNEREKYGL